MHAASCELHRQTASPNPLPFINVLCYGELRCTLTDAALSECWPMPAHRAGKWCKTGRGLICPRVQPATWQNNNGAISMFQRQFSRAEPTLTSPAINSECPLVFYNTSFSTRHLEIQSRDLCCSSWLGPNSHPTSSASGLTAILVRQTCLRAAG